MVLNEEGEQHWYSCHRSDYEKILDLAANHGVDVHEKGSFVPFMDTLFKVNYFNHFLHTNIIHFLQENIKVWKIEQKFLDCVFMPIGHPHWVIAKVHSVSW